MKLELKHLAPYLPYRLKITFDADDYAYELVGIENSLKGISLRSKFGDYGKADISNCKPILRPILDLTKEIEHNGEKFVPTEYFEIGDDDFGYHIDFGNGNVKLIKELEFCAKHNDFHDIQFIPAIVRDKLIEWNFDVFGLITKGLAVDINSISKR